MARGLVVFMESKEGLEYTHSCNVLFDTSSGFVDNLIPIDSVYLLTARVMIPYALMRSIVSRLDNRISVYRVWAGFLQTL